MINEKFGFDEFITEKMFLDLASCILIVCGSVELFKHYLPISPLCINFLISGLVTFVRIAIIGDFSFKGVVVGLFNLVL